MTEYPVRRNVVLLASGLVCLSGMFQLSVAVATVTLVLVTGVKGILGLGPAIFLVSGALAAGPAGRAMDRYGRMPIIRLGFLAGVVGCTITAAGCALVLALLMPIRPIWSIRASAMPESAQGRIMSSTTAPRDRSLHGCRKP